MPIALILGLLSAIPAILPPAAQLIASITAGVKQRGHFTDEQLKQIDDLLTMMNQRASDLEQERLGKLGVS